MSLLDRLADGSAGVRLALPKHEQLNVGEHQALIRDTAHGVGVRFSLLPWRLDLDPEHEALLRQDLERHSRALFLADHASSKKEAGGPFAPQPPRTDDPKWSPVIDVERLEHAGAPLLRVAQRRRYQPGSEIVAGQLFIPLQSGLFTIETLARDDTTGFRESALLMIFSKDGKSPEEVMATRTQRDYDDPAYDEAFPEHCLSRVRRAQRWFLSDDHLAVLVPMQQAPRGPVILEENGCVIIPPPRFLRLPPGTLPLSKTMAQFSRVTCGDAFDPRMFSVWGHPARLSRLQAAELEQLARSTIQGWEREGATGISIETTPLDGAHGGPAVRAVTRFNVQGAPKVTVQSWLGFADLAVVVVGNDATPAVPEEELLAELNEAVHTLRRSVGPPAASEKKPWWKPWG